VKSWSNTAGASAIEKRESQSTTAGTTVAQQCEECGKCCDEEEEELHVNQACVEGPHRAKGDRFERRQQQRVVEVREAVGRACEDGGIGPAERVEGMAFERPDRPGVVAVQRSDSESTRVIGDDGSDRDDPRDMDPARPGPARPLASAQAPKAGRE